MNNSTIKDVARQANVSTATVSRYFNNSEKVSADTQKRIRNAIDRLGFTPSNVAKALRSRGTNTIGYIIRDISNPNYAAVLQGAEITARKNSFSLILCNTFGNVEYEREHIKLLLRQRVAGVVIFMANDNINTLEPLIQNEIPVVLVDSELKGLELPRVSSNAHKGVYEGTRYLLSLGHRKIAFLAGNLNLWTGKERLRGHIDALKEFSIDPVYYAGGFDKQTGYDQAIEVLGTHPEVTAIFPASNQLTLGCLLALRDKKIKLPDQISLLGFDDTDFSYLHNPALSVVKRSIDLLGSTPINLLVRIIRNRNIRETGETVLPVEIILRNSCDSPK